MSQQVKTATFQGLPRDGLMQIRQSVKSSKSDPIQHIQFDYLQRLLMSYQQTQIALQADEKDRDDQEIQIDLVKSQSDLVQLENLISLKLQQTRANVVTVDPCHQKFIIERLQQLRKRIMQLPDARTDHTSPDLV